MATKTFVSGNWVGGTWSPAGDPTAADDVVFNGTSGACTINTGAVCRSIDCTGYTNTLTHTAGVTCSIGDGTAGAGNVALKFVAGMTYTRSNPSTSIFAFVSTSGTQQTITSGGKNLCTMNFTAAGSWIFSDDHTNGGTITHTAGTLNTNGKTITTSLITSSGSTTRTLTLGASTINLSSGWTVSGSNLTLNANTSTLALTGSNFTGGGLTYNIVTASGSVNFSGTNTFATLTITGAAVKTGQMILSADQTITGTFTCNANSVTNPYLITSNTVGTARTITAGTFTASNLIVFRDITGAGAATWTTGASGATYLGDQLGNSGITFTTPATQTANGTTSFSWSDSSRWTSRVPLPQDDVVISNAFSASQTITVDMPWMGKSITCSCSGSPVMTISTGTQIYGSLDLTGLLSLGSTTSNVDFRGRASYTVTSNSRSFPGSVTITMLTGSLTLLDAFECSVVGFGQLTLTSGTFITGNFSVVANNFSSASSNTREIQLGSSVVTLIGTGTVWNASASLTLSPGTSQIWINSSNAAIAKTFIGAGLTYYDLVVTGDNVVVTGSNTFNRIGIATAGGTVGLKLTSGTTQTVTTLTTNGSSGNLAILQSTTAGSAATISKSSGVISGLDYLSIKDSTATGGATFYAGSHSTNVSGNSGWIFTDAPYTGSASLSIGAVTLAASATFTKPTYTGTSSLSAGAATLAASATFKPTYTGIASLTTGPVSLAASATFTKPTYTGTASLTTGPSTLAASATFTKPTYTGSGTLIVGASTLAGTATFVKPTYTGTSSLTVGPATLSASATFTKPTYTGSSTLTVGPSVLSASAAFTPPAYTASVALTAPPATLAATATFTNPVYTGTSTLTVGAATLSGSGSFTKPEYAASATLTVSPATMAATATFDEPVYTGSATLQAGPSTLSASAQFTTPVYTGSATLTAPPATLSSSATFEKPEYTGTSTLQTGAATLSATATFALLQYTGTSSLTVGATTLDASAQFKPTYSATASLTVSSAVLAASATFVKPTYSGSSTLVTSSVVLTASATFNNPLSTGVASFTISPSTLSASASFTKPTYMAAAILVVGRTVLSAFATFRAAGGRLLALRRRTMR